MSKNISGPLWAGCVEDAHLLPLALIAELKAELERIEFGASSRAILTTKRTILYKIVKLNK